MFRLLRGGRHKASEASLSVTEDGEQFYSLFGVSRILGLNGTLGLFNLSDLSIDPEHGRAEFIRRAHRGLHINRESLIGMSALKGPIPDVEERNIAFADSVRLLRSVGL